MTALPIVTPGVRIPDVGMAPGLPAVVGTEVRVPLVTGGDIDYANFDHAASTPCLQTVWDAVTEFLPWYASAHRGQGYAARVSTEVYERAREAVKIFVDADHGSSVIFTRNATDALNLLASCVPKSCSVVVFDSEHHAALLPWRGLNVCRQVMPRSYEDLLHAAAAALDDCPPGPRLLVISAASNITGELLPVAELALLARRHGARIAVDAAQFLPHRALSMTDLGLDYVAFSGHKLYAPFGVGALVGRDDWLQTAPPYLVGGGATLSVTDRQVSWRDGSARHEAGTPNIVGAYALAVACRALTASRAHLAAHETKMLARLRPRLATVPGLRELALFDDADRVATVTFLIDGWETGYLATVLSAEHGIGVRHGGFCAHIGTTRLVEHAGGDGDSALRVSMGLGTTDEHLDRLIHALLRIVSGRVRWQYTDTDGQWRPDPDPRELPSFVTSR